MPGKEKKMKIITRKCDHCGEELKESYKVTMKRVAGDDPGEEWIIPDEKLLMKTQDLLNQKPSEICLQCFRQN